MDNIVRIKEPYYTAGKQFGWPGPMIGFGIKKSYLEGEGNLIVKVNKNKKTWACEKSTLREFTSKYNSYCTAKRNHAVVLAVVPWHIFKEVYEPKAVVTEEPVLIPQKRTYLPGMENWLKLNGGK